MSLVIFHITDIHICDENDRILQKVEQLKRACAAEVSSGDCVIIAVTGDIAFSGQQKQFELGFQIFDEIVRYLHEEKAVDAQVITVPGNHDCDFSENQTVRETIRKQIDERSAEQDGELVHFLTRTQNTYWNFLKDKTAEVSTNRICQTKSIGKIMFIALNTAWISSLHEKAGELCMPMNMLESINTADYDLVVTIMHHPLGWMHPDNVSKFKQYLRENADMLLVGHEHERDEKTEIGNNWRTVIFNGKELQADSDKDESSFAVYTFDEAFQMIIAKDYHWDDTKRMYCSRSHSTTPFARNLHSCANHLTPNTDTLNDLDDFGTLIHHHRVEHFKLKDLYCWPDLNPLDTDTLNPSATIPGDIIPETLLRNGISMIVGNSLVGKSALAKMLFLQYIEMGKCCIMCSAKDLTSRTQERVRREINACFIKQYSSESLEHFSQLSKNNKVLIIDDFDRNPFTDRSTVFDTLLSDFGAVILLSSTDADLMLLASKLKRLGEDKSLEIYSIRHLNNLKRRELITKWYTLGLGYENDDVEIDNRISHAEQIINEFIGRYTKLMPATPIHLISLLQSLEGFDAMNVDKSKYGYLYDILVQRSLREVGKDQGTLNIILAVLSQIAYKMLIDNKKVFTSEELISTVTTYNEKKKVYTEPIKFLEKLTAARILKVSIDGRCRFRYSYFYYYFAAHYIAKNLNDSDVRSVVENMSAKLNIEDYGNIMVFVCHFTNSKEVLDNVLLNAYLQLQSVTPFDFAKPGTLLDSAYERIEKYLLPNTVGEESDVKEQRKQDLSRRDELGLQDGEIDTQEDDVIEEKNKEIADIIIAIRTIDVLGQILKNYPGDIDGTDKVEIIESIDRVAMRVVGVMIEAFGYFEEDLVKILAEEAKEQDRTVSDIQLVGKVKEMFAALLSSFAFATVQRVARALGSEHLLIAMGEVVENHPEWISLKLANVHVQLNCSPTPPYEQIKKYYNDLEKEKLRFAAGTLKAIVAWHLRNNRCGQSTRDSLCSTLGLNKAHYLSPTSIVGTQKT